MPIIGIVASSTNQGLDTGSMFPIFATTVSTNGTSSVVFSSIPSTYKHLQIRVVAAQSAGGVLRLRFNGDSGSNYNSHWLYTNGSAVSSSQSSVVPTGINTAFTPAANAQGVAVIDILDYTNTNKYTTTRSIDGSDNNSVTAIELSSGVWLNTVEVSSITFTSQNGTFNAGSVFALYGIKGA